MKKGTGVFRRSSIDRINSPEQLNEYIRATNINVWIVLAGIIFLLLGILIWGIFGNIETTTDTVCIINDGKAVCYVIADNGKSLKKGQRIEIENSVGIIDSVSDKPVQLNEDVDDYAIYLGEYNEDDFCYIVISKIDVPDGIYKGKIVVENIHPISFITQR